MAAIAWGDVEGWFDAEWNGSLPDGIIRDTTVEDWNGVVSLARERGWRFEYQDDGSAAPLPADLAVAFDDHYRVLAVWPRPGVLVNFRLFSPASIDFDFSLQDVQDQQGLDWLCAFLRALGAKVNKTVEVMPEGFAQDPFLTYDPTTDTFTAVHAP